MAKCHDSEVTLISSQPNLFTAGTMKTDSHLDEGSPRQCNYIPITIIFPVTNPMQLIRQNVL